MAAPEPSAPLCPSTCGPIIEPGELGRRLTFRCELPEDHAGNHRDTWPMCVHEWTSKTPPAAAEAAR